MPLVVRIFLTIYPLLVYWVSRQHLSQPEEILAAFAFAVSLPLVLAVRWCFKHLGLGKGLGLVAFFVVFLILLTWFSGEGLLTGMQASYRLSFLLQDVAVFALFSWLFGSSLGNGRDPLCTSFARHVHTELSPALVSYTRKLTLVWSLFFFGCGLISTLLFVFAKPETWAFVSNALMPALTLVFFLGEVQGRRLLLPPEDVCGLFDTLKSFRHFNPFGTSRAPK